MLCRILPCDLILLPVLLLRGQRSADQHTPRRRALDDRFITTAEDTTDTWVPIKFRGNDDPSPPEASLWRSLREHTRRFKSMQNHDRLTGFLGLLFNKSGGVVVGNSKLVDVECRLVGVPGLLLPPRQLQKDALNDPAIFETFVKTGRRELGVIASPAMEIAIAYKWHAYARGRWHFAVVVYVVYLAVSLVGVVSLNCGHGHFSCNEPDGSVLGVSRDNSEVRIALRRTLARALCRTLAARPRLLQNARPRPRKTLACGLAHFRSWPVRSDGGLCLPGRIYLFRHGVSHRRDLPDLDGNVAREARQDLV